MNEVYLSTNVEYFLFREKVSAFFSVNDYEQLVFFRDEASGLKAIIAIHYKTLGLTMTVRLCRRMQQNKKSIE